MPWMTHPTLPNSLIEVPDQAADGHRRSGWRETEPPLPARLDPAQDGDDLDPGTVARAAAPDTDTGPVTPTRDPDDDADSEE